MADNCSRIILIFLNEFFSSRKCYLIDVFINFFSCHTNTTVGDCDSLVVKFNPDYQIAHFTFELADR